MESTKTVRTEMDTHTTEQETTDTEAMEMETVDPSIDRKALLEKVQIRDGSAYIAEGDTPTIVPVEELPEKFIRWQLDYKHSVYDAIERDEYVAFNAGHLPVVGTWEEASLIPNLANKGVGFTPKDEHLAHYLGIVEDAVDRISKLPPHAVNDTRALRIAAAREVYKHPEHIDWRRLGLLEIFEGSTFKNLVANPRASVLWTGNAPVFVSYQVDCVVEIMTPEDLRYRFSWAMRRLFEYEPFHVVQTIYPYAYCFWVTGSKDKTPKRRYPGKRSDNTVNEGHGKVEDGELAEAVTRMRNGLCPVNHG